MTIGGIIAGALLTLFLARPLEEAQVRVGLVGDNYRGDRIPRVSGILFVFSVLLASTLGAIVGAPEEAFRFGFAVVAMALAGLVDDLLGEQGPRGVRGHLEALKRGRLTTGVLKAITGLFLGLALSEGFSVIEKGLGSLGFALFANSINLLDKRPGRAVKGFLLAYFLLVIWQGPSSLPLIAPLLGGVLAYARLDFRGLAMMGDVGSAALGAALGFVFLMRPWTTGNSCIVVLLLVYNCVSDRYSLTRLVEEVSWLRWLDGLGIPAALPEKDSRHLVENDGKREE